MEQKIIEVLQTGGAMRPGEIAAAAGLDKDAVSKTIKQMASDGKVYSPKRCYYDLKK